MREPEGTLRTQLRGAAVVLEGTEGWAGCPSLGLRWAQAVLACFTLPCVCLAALGSEQQRLVFSLVF